MATARLDLMDEDSTQVISEYEGMTVENDVFDRFTEVCEKAKAPNIALLDALAFAEEKGINKTAGLNIHPYPPQ
ncbi:DUF1778 domain-containing protein [Endozoicomonas sp. 4G]|uniref:type II toxin -antitoxin system TacA 1-like antitoxin n=1 Tax=Endozoicomonas sp. 4G TaxID=2872754 RepID=UPI0020785560|nr:DUF1778 domain-containing protein [Endozoicomonas sp. 4G]